VTQRPERWFHRRYGADGNVIEHNSFVDEDNGVWIGSRMAENTLPMECSDPQYLTGHSLDHADDNVVRGNLFQNVTFGVRIEDDGAVVTDNEFVSDDAIDEAIVLGTRYRTTELLQPVDGAIVAGNTATIAGSPNPYRWIWGHTNTTFSDNRSLGRVVGLCEGVQPPVGPFAMTVAVIVLEDPENPPDGIRELPLPEELPPCPSTCETRGAVAKPVLIVRRLDTPAGDDTLSFRGELLLPHPFVPALDPVALGVGIAIDDAGGARVLDVTVPGGGWDRLSKAGWQVGRSGTIWKYRNRSATPPGGIATVTIRDLSDEQPGLVRVKVRGGRGSYPADPARLPLTGLVVLDPPTAGTGQCGVATFVAAGRRCTTNGKAVACR
jgi:hypothetical protein